MDNKLALKVFGGGWLIPIAVGGMMFAAAGTLNYWQGWLALVVFCVCSFLNTVSLFKRDPALLARRLKAGPAAEKRVSQKIIMCLTFGMFIGMFVVAGFDYRFGWSQMAPVVVVIGDCMIALGYGIFEYVFRENTFAAANINVESNQKVISSGPYGIVRHPMYFGALILIVGLSLALGSWWCLALGLVMLPILIWRIFDEERLLADELPGYREYCSSVKYRLIPGVF